LQIEVHWTTMDLQHTHTHCHAITENTLRGSFPKPHYLCQTYKRQ